MQHDEQLCAVTAATHQVSKLQGMKQVLAEEIMHV